MVDKQPQTTLQRFFSGLAEATFNVHLGVADPPLVDYLSQLLLRFVRLDAVHRVRSPRGERLQAIGEMLAEAEARVGTGRREVHRHIGDFALFWAGVFPEALRRRRGVVGDRYRDYCLHGKRAYMIASEIESDLEGDPPGDILERLSDQFELCAFGLREVRREWERRDDGPAPPLVIGN